VLPDRRAVVFDMDDTLYPYRHYRLSGFRAVAAHLERTHGVDSRIAYARLLCASRDEHRGRELQACIDEWELGADALGELLSVIHAHRPDIRLPPAVIRMLATLRRTGWKVGVLTNGPQPTQERKVTALRLTDHVDAVVYATAHGCGTGKPDAPPFHEIARQLAVPPAATVFVGDDERCDIGGAMRVGMQALRCCVWVPGEPRTRASAVVDRPALVPRLAAGLLDEVFTRHAA
jgi:putative hydrolase of the HAD superfamily